MRWLLSLCVAGLLAYALIPQRAEPVQNAIENPDAVSTARTEAAKAADRELRSWGSTLRSLKSPVQVAEPSDTEQAQPARYRPNGAENREPATAEAHLVEAVAKPVFWARVAFAARAHSEPSVSSPVIKFYPAGTELQVAAQRGAWIELLYPATSERGWVFDKYLVSIHGPSQTEPALASSAETETPDAVTAEMQPVRQSAKPAPKAKKNAEVTRQARRQTRWAKKQERRERKQRRASRRGAAAWSLGSPR